MSTRSYHRGPDRRDVQVNVRLSPSEYADATQRASALGMTVPNYLRSLLLTPPATPEVIAAAQYLNDHVAGLQDALATATAFLAQKGTP